jgi:peptidyl-tRNA hydrolase
MSALGRWYTGFGCMGHISTLDPKPETRNPKPETRNPKPETRNLKLQSWESGGQKKMALHVPDEPSLLQAQAKVLN